MRWREQRGALRIQGPQFTVASAKLISIELLLEGSSVLVASYRIGLYLEQGRVKERSTFSGSTDVGETAAHRKRKQPFKPLRNNLGKYIKSEQIIKWVKQAGQNYEKKLS